MEKELEERLQALEHKVDRINDRHDIEMLIGAVATLWSQKNMADYGKLFAYEMDDVSMELGDRGMYIGKDALEHLFKVEYQIPSNEGSLLRHFYTTPMIEVADDGKTAEGVFWTIGIESVVDSDGKAQAVWCFCQVAYEFIKIDQVWKIWHVHWYVIAKCDYEKGWCEDYDQWTTQWIDREKYPIADDVQVSMHEGMKITYHNPYNPGTIQEAIPAPPKPYDTWKNSNWIFRYVPECLPKDIINFDPDDPEFHC